MIFKGAKSGHARVAHGLVRVAGEDRLVRVARSARGFAIAPLPVAGGAGPGVSPASPPRPAARRSSSTRRVAYALHDLSLRHERLSLPPMSAALREKAIQQHCLTAQSSSKPLAISHAAPLPVAAAEAPAAARDADRSATASSDVLVVWCEREAVEQAHATLSDDGYGVARFVTPAVALSGLWRAAGKSLEADGSLVIVHLGAQLGTAACYTDGQLVLAREFSLPEGRWTAATAEPGTAERDADPQAGGAWGPAVIEEIGRSILLFNHRLRGKRAARIVISGDLPVPAPLVAQCAERFGLPAALLVDEVALDLSAFGEGAAGRSAAVPWMLAIAVALVALSGEPDINLLPVALAARQRRARLVAAGAAAATLVVLAVAAYHASYLAATGTLLADLRAHATLADATSRVTEDFSALYGERRAALGMLAFADRIRHPALVLSGVLQSLSAAATDSLIVEELEVEHARAPGGEAPERLEIRIRGRITTRSSSAAQAQFNLFHSRLGASPFLEAVRVEPLRIEASEDGRGSVLTFELRALPAAGGKG